MHLHQLLIAVAAVVTVAVNDFTALDSQSGKTADGGLQTAQSLIDHVETVGNLVSKAVNSSVHLINLAINQLVFELLAFTLRDFVGGQFLFQQ